MPKQGTVQYQDVSVWYRQSRDEFEKASLTMQAVVRRMRKEGYGVRYIAREFDVGHSYIVRLTRDISPKAKAS